MVMDAVALFVAASAHVRAKSVSYFVAYSTSAKSLSDSTSSHRFIASGHSTFTTSITPAYAAGFASSSALTAEHPLPRISRDSAS